MIETTNNFGLAGATSAKADLGISPREAVVFGDCMKTCFKCHSLLPLSEFYAHPMMGDGHLGKCKECTKTDVRENSHKRRGQYSGYEQMRFKRPERKRQILESAKRRRKLHPEKTRAYNMVARAIRKGDLVVQPCDAPGCTAKTQGHHDDYSKPLEVRWLCFKHHRELAHGQVVVAPLLI